jgi:hypothetical protein
VFSWLGWLATSSATEPTKVEQIVAFLTNVPWIGWAFAGFLVFAVAAMAVAKLTGDLSKIIEFVKKYLLPSKQEITDAQCQTQLKQLNRIVLEEVTDRLNQSLHYKVQMDIDRELQMQRVGRSDVPSSSPPVSRLIHRDFNPFETSAAPESVRDDLPTLELFQHPDIK